MSITRAGEGPVAVTADANALAGEMTKYIDLPANQYRGALVPVSALKAEAGYGIEVRSDSEVVIVFVDSSSEDNTRVISATNDANVTLQIPVLTGSAPLLSRLDVSNAPDKAVTSIRVRFSEPVGLAAINQGGLTVRSGSGKNITGCVLSPATQKCVAQTSTEVGELFDFVLSDPTTPDVVKTATITVAGSVKGSARTVKESAAIRHLPSTANGIAFALGNLAWDSCSPSADVLCIRSMVTQ
ncbi:MAG: hypothetical protein ABI560_19105 [Myxococcales bacterium]